MEGTPFGRYRLLELLGRGGMGEVWRAHDTATGRVVALKLLPPHLAEDEVFQERFRREAYAAAALNEPHAIPIHNFGEIDGRLYVDMRLVEGRDLGAILADGPLGARRAGPHRRSGGRSARRSTPHRTRPSRRQAVQHLGGQTRLRLSHRLRNRPRCRPNRFDEQRQHHRNLGLHVTGAAERRRSGPAGGHLRVDVRPLRMPDRSASVPWRRRAASRRPLDTTSAAAVHHASGGFTLL